MMKRLFCLFLLFSLPLFAQTSPLEELVQQLQSEEYTVVLRKYPYMDEAEKKQLIRYLIEALGETRYEMVRLRAAEALGRLGLDAKEAIPALLKTAQTDPYGYAQSYAIWALGEMGAEAKEAIPFLTETIKSTQLVNPLKATIALGKMGKLAEGAIPFLIHNLSEHPEKGVRYETVVTLGKIQATEASPYLLKMAEKADLRLHLAILVTLGQLKTPEGLAYILSALSNSEKAIRQKAVDSLAYFDPIPSEMVTLLITRLQLDSEFSVRLSIAKILKKNNANQEEANTFLLEAFHSEDTKIKMQVIQMIGELKAQDMFSLLLETLKNTTDREIRLSTIWAIGEFGAFAKDAIPELEPYLKDRNKSIQTMTKKSLKKIQAYK